MQPTAQAPLTGAPARPGLLPVCLLYAAAWMLLFVPSFLVNGPGFDPSLRQWLLVARDLCAGSAFLFVWARLRGGLPAFRPPHGRLERSLLGLAGAATVLFLWMRLAWGPRFVQDLAVFLQRSWIVPLRSATFAGFQQLGATVLLVDILRRYEQSEGRVVLLTATIFSALHLALVFLGLPLWWVLTLTAATFGAMLLWAWARVRWRQPWVGFALHYGFYIGLACVFAAVEV